MATLSYPERAAMSRRTKKRLHLARGRAREVIRLVQFLMGVEYDILSKQEYQSHLGEASSIWTEERASAMAWWMRAICDQLATFPASVIAARTGSTGQH